MSRVAVTTIAGLGMLLAALDIAVNVALPTMANALDADLESIQWVIVVFIATRASLVMGAGSFSDKFGLRTVYIFGAIAYLLSMICISLSPNLESVVGFRILQALRLGVYMPFRLLLQQRSFLSNKEVSAWDSLQPARLLVCCWELWGPVF